MTQIYKQIYKQVYKQTYRQIFFCLILLFLFGYARLFSQVTLGIDVLIQNQFAELKNKNVGLLINQASVTGDITISTLSVFLRTKECKLVSLFAPEHGLDAAVAAGEKVGDKFLNGIKINSLYGSTRKPTAEMLKGLDVFVYDIQDIGVRSYTFISTMINIMEACSDAGVAVMILDRPNPIGGDVIDGNVLEPSFKSFVGMLPVPYVYGLTCGELAYMANNEGWLNCKDKRCNLTVIQMKNWKRSMQWSNTGLTWVPTSPHIPTANSAFGYATTGTLGEIGIANIGVGYTLPFELIGTPWLDKNLFIKNLNNLDLIGLYFRPVSYKPFYAAFKEKECSGIHIIRRGEDVLPFTTTVALMTTLRDMKPGLLDSVKQTSWNMFNKICGTDKIKNYLLEGKSFDFITKSWQSGLVEYSIKREKYLLYD